MAQYIDKAAATSVCSSNRAYNTMQDISNLPCVKVVDREQFEKAVEELSEERKYWAMDITDWFEMLEEKLFGGEIK